MSKNVVASVRGKYTLEFKMEAVRLVKSGQSVPVTAKILGMPTQTLGNWIRLNEAGQLSGAGDKPVSNEQMELARLRAELARVKMERDILKNRPSGIARPVWIETGCRRTLRRCEDSGRLLFGGMLTPLKNLAQGNLRTRLWWRTI